MSLKAGWDDVEEHLATKCEVLARWQGLRVERGRGGWQIGFLDGSQRALLARRLTIYEVEAYLLGLRDRPRPSRGSSPRTRRQAAHA